MPADHYRALQKDAGVIDGVGRGLLAAGRWALPKLFRPAAAITEHALPTAAKAVAPGLEAGATKAPGLFTRANNFLNIGTGDFLSAAGRHLPGQIGTRVGQAGKLLSDPLSKYGVTGFAKGWTPQGAMQIASLGGMLPLVGGPEIPGMETLNNIAMPGFAAAEGAVSGIANSIKGTRMMSAGNKASFADDVAQGSRSAMYGLTGAAMQDPQMFNPGYLNSQFDGPMQQRIQGVNEGSAPGSGSWNHLKQFFGHGEGDFTTSLANDHTYGSGALTKQQSVKEAGWGSAFKTLEHYAFPALTAAPVATAFMGKPYDETEAQQTGVAAGAAGFQKAIEGMSPTERFFSRMDPTLAVAGADKAHPGFASGFADWHRATTGKDFQYGPAASVYNAWHGLGKNGPNDPKAPQKFYINSAMNLPAYLA